MMRPERSPRQNSDSGSLDDPSRHLREETFVAAVIQIAEDQVEFVTRRAGESMRHLSRVVDASAPLHGRLQPSRRLQRSFGARCFEYLRDSRAFVRI